MHINLYLFFYTGPRGPPSTSQCPRGSERAAGHNLIKQAGAWYTLVDQDGKEHKFQSKDFPSLMSDVETQEYIYNKICQAAILKYDSGKLGIDDVTTTDEFVNE